VTWILTIALLLGLYYYWKISSRLGERDDKKTKSGGKNTNGVNREGQKEKNVGHVDRDRVQNGDCSTEPRSKKNSGMPRVNLWRRNPPSEEPDSV
jgi:hypothetical protein